ncbi:Cardiolipin synthetase [Paramagnetospirillum magnetotacticum MS-1]|uniref:Phospholipase D n=1 Tax=Paramagnetospirillum magnetotacticum MS-1 TaxID=272627 RepID=A0A0C2V286_PARME|nr:phospholipase D family protein [Paramagnetospirillum magnetotacticum]KIL99176.1 Cardiolipin synthetase [Paramagnetospirillum magnetotacticum MS-1]
MGRVVAFLAPLLILLAACAPMRADYARPPSSAFDRPLETSLGKAFAAEQAGRPGQSGFHLLNNGVGALMTRAALIDRAERSIDFQTFIFDADEVGAFILDRLIAAARRGVRVRILLDDYELGLDDGLLARLDGEPNMEVRIFNPFPDRARWTRSAQMLWNLDRLGRRMHNKVLVADGQLALLGGRNISNHYFEGPSESNFRDIELLTTGAVATQAAASFDSFWASPMVGEVRAFDREPDAEALDTLLSLLAGASGPAAEYARSRDQYLARLTNPAQMIWAPAQVVAEPPDRLPEGAEKSSAEIARANAIVRQGAKHQVVYESAYFIPGDKGVQVLGDLVRRGVGVTVLTNSLAATDVVAVHAAYSLYRPALLEAGVRLFEYRTDARRPEPAGHLVHLGRSDSGLHAKIVVYDRVTVWVGSANFDPRSRHLNTEIGVMIHSPELAEKLLAGIERDFDPAHSWRLEANPGAATGPVAWVGERDGHMVRLETEPDGDLWRGIRTLFYSVLPGIEELL